MQTSMYPCNDNCRYELRAVEEAISEINRGTSICLESARQIECGCLCDGEKDFIDGLNIEELGVKCLTEALDDLDNACIKDEGCIEKGLREIRDGLKREKTGFCMVLNYDICDGVQSICKGVQKITDGIADILSGLNTRPRRPCYECECELRKGIHDVREGIELTNKAIHDIEDRRVRKGEEHLEAALRELEHGLDALDEADGDCAFNCEEEREFHDGMHKIREGTRLIRHALREIRKGVIGEGLAESREGLCLVEDGLFCVLKAVRDYAD